MEYEHSPVLLDECILGMDIHPGGIYVDGTLGGGGHSLEIARALSDKGRLIAIDRDKRAIERAGVRLEPFMDRVTMVHGNFSDLKAIISELDIDGVSGMLFDLGVSSPQLDEAERGFSYMANSPLDMRMDETQELTAAIIVNTWEQDRLKRILYDLGEERYAPQIARQIIARRNIKSIETTFELVDIVKSAMPAAALREKQHPAKRSFQAIRMAVNGELEAISAMLGDAVDLLLPGGRLCVISFHSLEDRLVKNAFSSRERGCTCPRDFPVCTCGFKQTLKLISRKPVISSKEELARNPRARSAKLRIAEKV